MSKKNEKLSTAERRALIHGIDAPKLIPFTEDHFVQVNSNKPSKWATSFKTKDSKKNKTMVK
jgi:hypothetical protein